MVKGIVMDSDSAEARMQVIESCIDFMEELGMPLLPWQATAFRAIMMHDDSVIVAVPPQHPIWGGTTTPSNPPWGGGGVENVQSLPLPPHLTYSMPPESYDE
jgi:hypothetical protein